MEMNERISGHGGLKYTLKVFPAKPQKLSRDSSDTGSKITLSFPRKHGQ
jgi:hypothetical protein